MGMKGVRKGLKGCFVRCEGCRMYLELDEARKVVGGDVVDWVRFRCEKCREGSQVREEVVSEVENEETRIVSTESEPEVSRAGLVRTEGREISESGSVGGESLLSFRRALVVGDSLVRNIDRAFCGRDRLHRTVACFPGAKIEDVESRIDGLTRTRADENMVVVVQIGTNNLVRDSLGVITEKYEKLFVHFRGRKNVRLVVSALLPRVGNRGLGVKLREVNRWLEEYCRARGIRFLSVWDRFYGDSSMYKRDLLHPSGKGAWALGKEFEREVCEIQGEFVGSRISLN